MLRRMVKLGPRLHRKSLQDRAAQYNKQQSIQTAIDDNDYNAYVKAITPTQEEFTSIVERNKSQKAIQQAITDKDYDAL